MSIHRFEARRRPLGAKLGIVTAMIACAGCSAAQGGDPTGTNAPGAPSATADAVTVSIQGFAQSSDGSTIAGVAVCLRTDPTTSAGAACTTSDMSGAWRIAGAPANSWVAVTLIQDGFFPTLRPIATGTSDVAIPAGGAVLVGSSQMPNLMGAPIEEASGHVAFASATPGARSIAEPTVTVAPIGGASIVPVYFDAEGNPMPGANAGATGAFANLAPGYYEITFAGASVACSDLGGLYGYPITSYTPDGQARMLVPVVAGFLTAPVAASCSPAITQ
jgi:hypothetical protein